MKAHDRTPSAHRLLLLIAACLLFPCGSAAQQKSAPEPLAVLAGQPIYESQLPADEQAQLVRMLQQLNAVRLRALHAVVDHRLVEAEAKKKGVTPAELFEAEVVSKVAGPSDEQVAAYYQAHQAQFQQPLDQAKDKIRQGMKELDIQRARTAYVRRLFQHALDSGELSVLFPAPLPDREVGRGADQGQPARSMNPSMNKEPQ